MPQKPRYFATPAELRTWLEVNHATTNELLVGFYKTSSGKPSITWPESVDEALCFGWIDAKRKSLGAEAYTIRFVPRKPTSIWSAINVAKIEALRKAGKMRPAGEAAFAKRTAAKTGVYSFERSEAAKLSDDQAAQLAANTAAHAWFSAQAPYYQRTAIHWVISAKQDVTRERRLATLIADSAAGRRIPPMRLAREPGSGEAGSETTTARAGEAGSPASTPRTKLETAVPKTTSESAPKTSTKPTMPAANTSATPATNRSTTPAANRSTTPARKKSTTPATTKSTTPATKKQTSAKKTAPKKR